MNIATKYPTYIKKELPQNKTTSGNADNPPQNYGTLSFKGGANLPAKIVQGVVDKSDDAVIILRKTADELIQSVKKVAGKRCFDAKLIDPMNKIFGDDFFAQQVKKAGAKISQDGTKYELDDFSFLKDDLMGAIPRLFADVVHGASNAFQKITKKPPKEGGYISKILNEREAQNARRWVLNTLGELTSANKSTGLLNYRSLDEFKDFVASNVTKIKKGYETRDERTLNRVVTSIVSALYSGADFFNISMLEKDNKEDAKEAGAGKIKQDLRRMGWNAATTFLSLSVFDRVTKNNILLNSLVIAGSALAAEVFSRISSKTPLVPLSSERAAKIAQERKSQKQQKVNNTPKEQADNKNVQFKSNLKANEGLFKNFAGADGTIAALSVQKAQIANQNAKTQIADDKKDKKSSNLPLILLGAFGAATAIFFGMKAYRGDYSVLKHKKEFLDGTKSLKAFNETKEKISKTKTPIWEKLKKRVTKKSVSFDREKLVNSLTALANKTNDTASKDAINMYIDIAEKIQSDKISTSIDKPITKALIDGVTKVFKTIYDIFTIPAKGINWVIDNKLTDNAQITKEFNAYASEVSEDLNKKYGKQLYEVYKLINPDDVENQSFFEKATMRARKFFNKVFNKTELTDEQKLEKLLARIRNVETSQETGELANISRTMVTAIGTYFFVNDYRNRVLIESEGKNVEGANEEMKQRIGHKIANFIINGTLMNTFNSVFKGPVNNSLLGAATVASATELTNEFLVRKSICQPVFPKKSRDEIIAIEEKQLEAKGLWGAWTRLFKKITGKKTLSQKAKITTGLVGNAKPQKVNAHQS